MKKRQIIITAILCLIFMACKKEKKRICAIYDGPTAYSVGTIDKFSTSFAKVTYTYSFQVDGQNYEGQEKGYGIGQKNESLVGKSFVVVYVSGNPSNSDLNLNHLIESDTDFVEFKNENPNTPPPDFPKCK